MSPLTQCNRDAFRGVPGFHEYTDAVERVPTRQYHFRRAGFGPCRGHARRCNNTETKKGSKT